MRCRHLTKIYPFQSLSGLNYTHPFLWMGSNSTSDTKSVQFDTPNSLRALDTFVSRIAHWKWPNDNLFRLHYTTDPRVSLRSIHYKLAFNAKHNRIYLPHPYTAYPYVHVLHTRTCMYCIHVRACTAHMYVLSSSTRTHYMFGVLNLFSRLSIYYINYRVSYISAHNGFGPWGKPTIFTTGEP